jgi:hypothetical protein
MEQTENDLTEPPQMVEIYQFRVYLRQISPQIWRRFLIRSDSTLADLHYILQILMDWSDDHLHQFLIHGKTYGLYRPGGLWHDQSASEVKLTDLHLRLKERFLYKYDFFDHWEHEIRLEQLIPLAPKKVYPVCTGGGGASPPEDCGGAWAFLEQKQHHTTTQIWWRLIEMLEDGEAPVADYLPEIRQWQYWLKVDQFDRQVVNRRLKLYAEGDEDWHWPQEMHAAPDTLKELTKPLKSVKPKVSEVV